MTTVAKADKSRLTIRGLIDGHHYIVREQPGGWWITPEKTHRVKKSGMSADAFAQLYRSRTPLGADTSKEISANLAAIDNSPGKYQFPPSVRFNVPFCISYAFRTAA